MASAAGDERESEERARGRELAVHETHASSAGSNASRFISWPTAALMRARRVDVYPYTNTRCVK
jgi:hypothetical protein